SGRGAAEGGGEDRDEGEEHDEQDAPVPPDPDQMESGHEARLAAAIRPQPDARGYTAETRGDAPLDLHSRTEVHLAETGGHRRLDAMENIRVRQGEPHEGDAPQVGGRDRDIAEGWRRRSEDREAEGREGGRGDRELFKTNRQAGERDPDRGQDREDEDEARQSADGGLRKSDAEDHEHLGCKED